MIPLVSKVFEDYNFSGFAYVSSGEKELFLKQGYADREKRVEFSRSIKFPLASLTKQFIAFAVLLCQDRGLLNINDVLTKYIPQLSFGDDVTLTDLMGMTSGIKDRYEGSETLVCESTMYYWQRNRDIFYRDISIDELVSVLNNYSSEFKHDSDFEYSNFNYRFLGAVIEQVSDISLEAFLYENIFRPLEMYDTCLGTDNSEVKSYDRDLFTGNVCNKGADIGIVSTLDDMKKWTKALYERRLLSQDSYDTFLTPNRWSYCSGMWKNGGTYIHDGKLMCIHTAMSLDMESGEAGLYLRNCDPVPNNDMRIVYFPVVNADDGILKLEVWNISKTCELTVFSVDVLDRNGKVLYSDCGQLIHITNEGEERNAVDFTEESQRSIFINIQKLLGNDFSSDNRYFLRVKSFCTSLAQLGMVYRSGGEWLSRYYNIFHDKNMSWELFCEALSAVNMHLLFF